MLPIGQKGEECSSDSEIVSGSPAAAVGTKSAPKFAPFARCRNS